MIKEIREPLIFEISAAGKRAAELPALDVPEKKDLLAGVALRRELEDFPEVSETEIVRHFTRLSQKNYCVDLGLYPLGSCTMKYNPKINERLSAHPAFAGSHPLAPVGSHPGEPGGPENARRPSLRDRRHGRFHAPAGGRGPRRADGHDAHPGRPRGPGRCPEVRPHPGLRPRHEPVVGPPLRLHGQGDQVQREGDHRPGLARAGHDR